MWSQFLSNPLPEHIYPAHSAFYRTRHLERNAELGISLHVLEENLRPAEVGSFVPFTIVVACSTHQAMEKNSADTLDREFVDICEEMKFDWPEFLPERIKAGITEIALGLIVF